MKTTISFYIDGTLISKIDRDQEVTGENLVIPNVGDHVSRIRKGLATPLKGMVIGRHFTFFEEEVRVILTLEA